MRFEIKGLGQGYGDRTVLEDVSLSAESGEFITVLGPNGSGKSTLIRTICNVMSPRQGSLEIDGRAVGGMDRKELARIVSYVPQTCASFGYTTVFETVLMGRRPYSEWSYSEDDIRKAIDAMKVMSVDGLHDRYVSNLSGGQMQRVFIARSLAQDPEFYLFDEPTSSLDLKFQLESMNIMRSMVKERGSCLIVALHDLNLALRFSDKVLVLKDSHVYDFGPVSEVITPRMIAEVYGVRADIVENERGRYIQPYDYIGTVPCDL
ncbi:MAG: ABC transporter ATP-binding protein [Thermoplasmatales archaeon]|nr:ABC transporter ATP-binding protein [Thermoplasmatales archaeon]